MFSSQHGVLARVFLIIWMMVKHGVFSSQHGVFGQHGLSTLTLTKSLIRVDHGIYWAMFGPFGLLNWALFLGPSYKECKKVFYPSLDT